MITAREILSMFENNFETELKSLGFTKEDFNSFYLSDKNLDKLLQNLKNKIDYVGSVFFRLGSDRKHKTVELIFPDYDLSKYKNLNGEVDSFGQDFYNLITLKTARNPYDVSAPAYGLTHESTETQNIKKEIDKQLKSKIKKVNYSKLNPKSKEYKDIQKLKDISLSLEEDKDTDTNFIFDFIKEYKNNEAFSTDILGLIQKYNLNTDTDDDLMNNLKEISPQDFTNLLKEINVLVDSKKEFI